MILHILFFKPEIQHFFYIAMKIFFTWGLDGIDSSDTNTSKIVKDLTDSICHIRKKWFPSASTLDYYITTFPFHLAQFGCRCLLRPSDGALSKSGPWFSAASGQSPSSRWSLSSCHFPWNEKVRKCVFTKQGLTTDSDQSAAATGPGPVRSGCGDEILQSIVRTLLEFKQSLHIWLTQIISPQIQCS